MVGGLAFGAARLNGDERDMTSGRPNPSWRRHWPRVLLLVPFLGVLWVPSYNRIEPALAGIPFFYWYQLAWVILGAAIVFAVYLIETHVTGTSGESESGSNVDSPGDAL